MIHSQIKTDYQKRRDHKGEALSLKMNKNIARLISDNMNNLLDQIYILRYDEWKDNSDMRTGDDSRELKDTKIFVFRSLKSAKDYAIKHYISNHKYEYTNKDDLIKQKNELIRQEYINKLERTNYVYLEWKYSSKYIELEIDEYSFND